jgi:hypothetical protein
MFVRNLRVVVTVTMLLFLPACQREDKPSVLRIRDKQELASFQLKSSTGVRDGDNLRAQVVFAGDGSQLQMDMRFRVGIPTRFESGSYVLTQAGLSTRGSITAQNVTFLGGQADRPSLGGTFELVSGDVGLYLVRFPPRELQPPHTEPRP